MTALRALSLIALLLVVASIATPSARADDEKLDLWRDPVALRRHLEAACDAVEGVCGTHFGQRPTVRVSTQDQVLEVLQGRLDGEVGMIEATPDEQRQFLAYYDPMSLVVHIVPDALPRIARFLGSDQLLGEDVLRIILVHEAVHALDFQRFPVQWTLACCAASDERIATEAVLEGHAQLIAEEVSRAWGIETAFQALTRLYTGSPPDGEDSNLYAFDQEAAFTYLQGHAFMRAVRNARSVHGVDAVLRDPPSETRVIDRPLLWLHPETRGEEPDLQAVLEVFRPLVPSADWEVAKWRVLGPAIPVLPAEGTDGTGEVESYIDNHGLYAGAPDGNRYVNVLLAYCRSEEHAQRFVRAIRRVDTDRDRATEWRAARRREGAGTNGKLEGFTSQRRASGNGDRATLRLHVARVGRHVIELSSYGVTRTGPAPEDAVLDLAARLLRAAPSSASAIALRAHLRRFLEARAEERVDEANTLLRDLLPSQADLRRVVRTDYASDFESGYTGVRIALRSTVVARATLDSSFEEADAQTRVRAWAATTEELATRSGWSDRFPAAMRRFAVEQAAPGCTWIVLVLTPPDREPSTYACFARLGDRFLWIAEPWAVIQD